MSKNAMRASNAVRTPQDGCHVSLHVYSGNLVSTRAQRCARRRATQERQTHGWKLEMDRQIFLLTSKRPDGVSM